VFTMNAEPQYSETAMNDKDLPYSGPERRMTDIATFQLMAETRQKTLDLEKMMTDKIEQVKEELDAHMLKSEQRHAELMRSMDELKQSTLAAIMGINNLVEDNRKMFARSVPNGDIEEHRRAHEAWMRKAERDEKFYNEIKTNTVKGLLLLAAGWAMASLWSAFLQGPVGK